jgi:hypothetical protein
MSDDWKGGKNPLSFFAGWRRIGGRTCFKHRARAHVYYLGDAYASGLIMFGMFFYELDSIVTGLIASILLIMIYLYRMGHS